MEFLIKTELCERKKYLTENLNSLINCSWRGWTDFTLIKFRVHLPDLPEISEEENNGNGRYILP